MGPILRLFRYLIIAPLVAGRGSRVAAMPRVIVPGRATAVLHAWGDEPDRARVTKLDSRLRRDGEWVVMTDAVEPHTLAGEKVVLRRVERADVAELVRIRRTPEVHGRWGDVDADLDDGWPFDDPDTIIFTVLLGGSVTGLIQYWEEREPTHRNAGIDIFLDPVVHGRGHGRDALRTLARHLVRDRGHHRLVIDPAADNEPAIRSYAAVGFRPVGVMRAYERDVDAETWHDALLMDLLASDLDMGGDVKT